MGKPQVTLTFAGDADKLTRTFDEVGSAARKMDTDVGSASRDVGSSLDTVGEAADGAEGKAQGFSDTLTGTKDVMGGAAEIAKGNLFEGFVQVGQGAADLAGGLASFVIPAIKNMTTSMIGNAVQTVRSTAAAVAHGVASFAVSAATKAWTATQWLLNAALTANPIGLVVVAIALLVAAIVIAWKRSETFRAVVTGALNAVLGVAKAVGRWFRDTFWPWLKGVWDAVSGGAVAMRDAIGRTFTGLVKWLGAIPGRIGSALSGAWNGITGGLGAAIGWVSDRIAGLVKWAGGIPGRISAKVSGAFDGIKDAFRSAINWIINKWNDLSFSIPGVDTHIPGVGTVGGFTIGTPNIPTFHAGGVMPGAPGTEGLALLQAGERINPAGRSGGGVTINVNGALDPVAVALQIQKVLLNLKRTNGGTELGIA